MQELMLFYMYITPRIFRAVPDLHEEIRTVKTFYAIFFQTVCSRSLHIMAHESHSERLTGHLCYVYSKKKTSLVSHEKVES